jgi:elongation factor Ts
MEISAADVKKLREKTGAGPMECKRALQDSDGDFAKAEKLLKEKGLAAVEKRSDRATNEGKIFVKVTGDGLTDGSGGAQAVLVELSSETDFVARNPEFIELGGVIANLVLEKGYTEPNEQLSGMVTDLATKIRENMGLKRIKLVKGTANQYLAKYIHGDGNIGVVVALGADKAEVLKTEEAKALAFNLTLHVAAFNPMVLDRGKVDPQFLKEQEDIFRKQMAADEKLANKPANVTDKILAGKVNKYLEDICFLEQKYVKDEKFTVAQILADTGKQLGAVLSIDEYVYYKVGG